MQTTLNQGQIRGLQIQAQQTLTLFECDKERRLYQYYEDHKHFRKGDRKGFFGTHQADQTYEQYVQAELERFCRTNPFLLRDTGSAFYRMKHNLYDWQIERLEALVRELSVAIQLNLSQVTVKVNDLAVIKIQPPVKIDPCTK